uniref:Protein lin-54 homolog n=1 Tax=Cacopsylla melanoneura TaxID=428564 RepID=A0A8D9B386_9HEMI
MSSDPADNILSVDVESSNIKQEMDLDAISLHSGDYLDGIASDDQEPSVEENSETIIVSNRDEESVENQVEDFLEKENNMMVTTEETVESTEMSTELEESSTNLNSSDEQDIVTSGDAIKIQMSTPSVQKIMGTKFVNTKGQNVLHRPLSMSNVTSFKKPVTSLASGSRNIVTKVMVSQANSGQPILLTSQDSNKLVKIVSSAPSNNTTKTITLAQAQKFGLLSPGKLQQILPIGSGGKNIIINKAIVTSPKKVTTIKSPAKILPAPGPPQSAVIRTANLIPQRILVKQNTLKPNTGQVIRIPASQMSALGLQQIQLPGSQKVQYVRIVQTSASGNIKTVSSAPPTTVYLSSNTVTTPGITNISETMVTLPADRNGTNSSPAVVSNSSSSTCILLPASYLANLDLKIKPEKLISSGSIAAGSSSSVVSSADSFVQTVKLKPLASAAAVADPSSSTPLTSLTTSTPASEQQGDPVGDFDDSSVRSEEISTSVLESKMSAGARTLEPNGIRPRKPCNCTKSMCLKLYCDCFANGEFCYQCNCNSCFNNIEHEDDRHHAIRQCLERNPNAFRPKIGKCLVGEGERRHTKGCNCKRSGCLKNYCECYEAKIPCSNNCKCVSCRNVEENLFLRLCQSERTDKPMEAWKNKMADDDDHSRLWSTKLAFSFMSETIVQATCHCLFAQADKAKKSDVEEEELQKIILEECGNCLQQIIVIASKSLSQKSHNS